MEETMDTYITDDMKKESKTIKIVTIVGYTFAVLSPLSIQLSRWFFDTEKYTNHDSVLLALAFFLLGSIGLYYWLYAIKYKLSITETRIFVRTLFRSFQINLTEVTCYTYKRYNKSVFYQFTFFTKKGRLMISTRYRDELISLLVKNNIHKDH